MRSLRLAVLPLLVATSLAAQTPEPSTTPATPVAAVAPARTAFLDLAALVGDRQRFGLEPLIFGRWTVGLVGSHYNTGSPTIYGRVYATPTVGGQTALPIVCPASGCPVPIGMGPASSSYASWSIDFAVRYYPAALSLSDPRQRLMVYVGEFIGYQWRTLTQVSYPPVPLPLTPGNPCAYPGCANPSVSKEHFTGWEPGAEIGVRLEPLGPLFVDVGGWFKIVGVDDPTQQIRPGHLDARLVAAVGVGW